MKQKLYLIILLALSAAGFGQTMVHNDTLHVSEGAEAVIDSTRLKYFHAEPLQYALLALPQHGLLLLDGNPLTLSNAFSQMQIDESRLSYQHDGGETEIDSFLFNVTAIPRSGIETVAGTFHISITPVNDPPQLDSIPGDTIAEGGSFDPINLNNYVSDPDNPDNEIAWDVQGEGGLVLTLIDSLLSIAVPDSEWFGSEILTFIASDGEYADTTTSIFEVIPVNDPPQLDSIPGETIAEGGAFAPINLNDYVSDPDNADNEIVWQVQGEGGLVLTLIDSLLSIAVPDSEWYGIDTLTFIAGDGEYNDTTTSIFEVTPVNDPPQLSDIPDQTIPEGGFVLIPLESYVFDPDDPISSLGWQPSGSTFLDVNIDPNRIAIVAASDPDWTGTDSITFTVTDTSGAADSATVRFTVIGIPDPPSVHTIPDQSIWEDGSFTVINLNAFVEDPDTPDDEISWRVSGDSALLVNIEDSLLTITVSDPEWSGSERLTFIATDPDSLSDSTSAVFEVRPVNDPPEISDIPGQSIEEDDAFSDIALDSFVTDPDNAPEEMTWTFSGTQFLKVVIDANRIATITRLDPNFNGSETITFTVRDPEERSDSDTAVFSVGPVNDPPLVSPIAGQEIPEGDAFGPIPLDQAVEDPDDPDENIDWTVSGNIDLQVSINSSRVAIISTPHENWNGQETLVFTATDTSGLSDSIAVVLTVNAINDTPVVVLPIRDLTIPLDDGDRLNYVDLNEIFYDVEDGSRLHFSLLSPPDPRLLTAVIDAADSTLDLLIQPGQSGTTEITVQAQDNGEAGNDTLTVAITFTVRVLRAPSVSNTIAGIPVYQQPLAVTAVVKAENPLDSVLLRYASSEFSARFLEPRPMRAINDSTFQLAIDSLEVNAAGLKYFVEVVDIFGLRVTSDTVFLPVTIPAGELSQSYRRDRWFMFSLPYESAQNQLSQVLSSLGQKSNRRWEIFRVPPSGSADPEDYFGFLQLLLQQDYGRFMPGNAFWLYVQEADADMLALPERTSIKGDSLLRIELHQGWNQVANPYPFEIFWEQVDSDPPIHLKAYRYLPDAGNWTNDIAETNFVLAPWDGFAVYADLPATLTFHPQRPVNANGALGKQAAANSWKLILQAENPHGAALGALGTAPDAQAEADRRDYPSPPLLEDQFVNLYFHRPEWGAQAGDYCTDFRPGTAAGQQWTFTLHSSANSAALTVDGLGSLPGDYQALIYDRQTRTSYPLEGTEALQLGDVANHTRDRFVLLAGTPGYLAQALETISDLVPAEFRLRQNYPNPFNPETVIHYQLARSGTVTLAVYNILGQKVATLVDEAQEAGYYQVRWNGRNEHGSRTASGVYFYRLETGGFTQTRKMIKLQ